MKKVDPVLVIIVLLMVCATILTIADKPIASTLWTILGVIGLFAIMQEETTCLKDQ